MITLHWYLYYDIAWWLSLLFEAAGIVYLSLLSRLMVDRTFDSSHSLASSARMERARTRMIDGRR